MIDVTRNLLMTIFIAFSLVSQVKAHPSHDVRLLNAEEKVNASPNDWRTYFHRALLLLEDGEKTSATLDFTKVEQLSNRDNASLGYGLVAQLEGDCNKAIDEFKRFLRVNPNDEMALAKLAECLMASHQIRAATQAFVKLTEISRNPDYFFRAAKNYQLMGQDFIPEALAIIDKAHKTLGPLAHFYQLSFQILFSAGRFDEAEAELFQLEKIIGNIPAVKLKKAELHLAKKEITEARNLLLAILQQTQQIKYPSTAHLNLQSKAQYALDQIDRQEATHAHAQFSAH